MATISTGTGAPGGDLPRAVSEAAGSNPYDKWIESLGVPVHRDYYLEDARTLKLGAWKERECQAGFVQLVGQQGITGVYVTELAPGQSLPPFKLGVDEVIYVLEGRGLTSLSGSDQTAPRSFEWQKHALFRVPANHGYQLTNTRGNERARLLHVNYLPAALALQPDPDGFINNPMAKVREGEWALYSEAKGIDDPRGRASHGGLTWIGNFFPDMRTWDKLDPFRHRGAGGTAVHIEFPGSPVTAHMSVFPSRTYKKGHRHGPGVIIVIPAGEGYSIMWPEGKEKIVVPWHEGSVFVPPARWFHQHFNVSAGSDRYLALHSPRVIGALFGGGEAIEDRARDQIEYPDEDPWIRERFEAELANRGLTSLMVEEAYRDRNYQWKDMTGG